MFKEVLKIENLNVQAKKNNVWIKTVHDVSFTIGEGETLALIGETYSGKTSIVSSLFQLHNQTNFTVSGDFYFKDTYLNEMEKEVFDKKITKEIGVIPQEQEDFQKSRENLQQQFIKLIEKHTILEKEESKRYFFQIMKKVGVTAVEKTKDEKFKKLPLEIQRRILMGVMFIKKPSLLILDEFMQGIDVITQMELLDLVHLYQTETGAGVLLSTNDIRIAAELADRAAVLKTGEIIEENTLSELLDRPKSAYAKKMVYSAEQKYEKIETEISSEKVAAKNLKGHYTKRSGFLYLVKEEIEAVDSISLEFQKGKIYGVIGETGAGKTTLAKMISGKIKQTSGVIHVQSQEAEQFKVQYISPPNSQTLKKTKTIADLLNRSPQIKSKELLNLINLSEKAGYKTEKLSFEEKIRVSLAQAAAENPAILIVDEPTLKVDFQDHAGIWQSLLNLQHYFSFGLVIITQELSVLKNSADNLIVMQSGRVVETGAVDKIYQQPAHIYTKRMLAAVPQMDPSVRETHRAVRERVASEYRIEYENYYDYDHRPSELIKLEKNHYAAQRFK